MNDVKLISHSDYVAAHEQEKTNKRSLVFAHYNETICGIMNGRYANKNFNFPIIFEMPTAGIESEDIEFEIAIKIFKAAGWEQANLVACRSGVGVIIERNKVVNIR